MYMYVVYTRKWSSAHALGGVNGVALFITADEQFQLNWGFCFIVQALFPEGFPFHQFILILYDFRCYFYLKPVYILV